MINSLNLNIYRKVNNKEMSILMIVVCFSW